MSKKIQKYILSKNRKKAHQKHYFGGKCEINWLTLYFTRRGFSIAKIMDFQKLFLTKLPGTVRMLSRLSRIKSSISRLFLAL